MKKCPFCDSSTYSRVLTETKFTRVIFSNPRLVKGHLLMVPKRHVEEPWELQANEIEDIFQLIKTLQPQLARKIGAGCDLRQNYRPFLAQDRIKVDHVHYHLIPRVFEDELYKKSQIYEREMFSDLPVAEIEEVTAALDIKD